MTDDLRKSFEKLLKNGDYVKAGTELIKFMKLDPENRDAKMLYGTCRLLQGDTETAKRIYDELEPFYSKSDNIPKSEKNFWQKYHRWIIIYGSAAALFVVGGAAIAGIAFFGSNAGMFGTLTPSAATAPKYGGAPVSYYCKECGKPTEIAFGWGADNEAELRAKVDKGLIPCKTCGKDTPYSRTKPDNDREGKNYE